MKINRKALDLVGLGLKPDTVAKLSESQIKSLHSRLLQEVVTQTTTKTLNIPRADMEKGNVQLPPSDTGKGYVLKKTGTGDYKATQLEGGEMKEDQDVSVGDSEKGQITQQPHQVQNWDGTDDDTNPSSSAHDEEGTVESEIKEDKKKKKKSNPWAICTAQMGKEFGTTERSDWNEGQMKKYERCVKDVKKSISEGKEPLSLFLENEIMRIVEKHIPPKITKGDLMKYLNEDGPAVAPDKPKTKPGTKPGKPSEKPKKPSHPFKNPNPGEKPAPKAGKYEKVKDTLIDLIKDLLDN